MGLVSAMIELKTVIVDMPIQLGPPLSEHEWHELLQRHREAMTVELRELNPNDPRFAEIERAARGLFWSGVTARIQ